MGLLSTARVGLHHPCTTPAPAPSPDEKDKMVYRALVFTTVLMAILGSTLCVVGVERLIRGRFTLFSMARFLLRFAFVIFLPLLSYMNSHSNGNVDQILFVLMWMLLVELIRKKVQAMVPSADGSFSRASCKFKPMNHSDEMTRLVWIGYLIYTNINNSSQSVMTMFAILWSLVLAKLGQRVFNEWKAQESLTAAGNAQLIAGYMQYVLGKDGASTCTDDPMANCEYVVMGEEKLVLEKKERRHIKRHDPKVLTITTPHCGHGVGRFPHDQNELKHVHLRVDLDKVNSLVTVKMIWQELGGLPRLCCLFTKRGRDFIDHLRLLCLSFSFFKLMRRRFEHYPMVEVGSTMTRRLMLQGLLSHGGSGSGSKTTDEESAMVAFRVLHLELDFLDNYYQAGAPVVMSAPWLFFINFLSSLLFVLVYIITAAILVVRAVHHHDYTHITLYFIITILLLVTLLAVEITEVLTAYLLSNWFLVHLLCLYTAKGRFLWNCLVKPIICCFIAFRFLVLYSLRIALLLVGRPINEKKMKIKQVSILHVCEPVRKILSSASPVTLTSQAKLAIIEFLKQINLDTGDVSLLDLGSFNVSGKTATEIILACHLATELLEMEHGKQKKKKKNPQDPDHRTVATTLSRYCMYLVARAPELLPDDERWVSDTYEDVRSCLEEVASRRWCSCATRCGGGAWRRRCWKAVKEMGEEQLKDTTVWDGVVLFRQLRLMEATAAWKDLAGFWVRLLVYLAPSNDVEGHAMALASSGGDLITCLWAFCTHAGIRRQSSPDQAERHDAHEPRGSQV